MAEKYKQLKEILRDMGSVLVAYSGGVDSTFLLKVAHDVLGERAIAVTASSQTYPSFEIDDAVRLARQIGVRLITTHTDELDNEAFVRNAPDRCYQCKTELIAKLKKIAGHEGIAWVAHGANADDLNDYRPGGEAARQLGARAPLQEAGLTKAEIRQLSKRLDLPTWDKPSFACLASRFPYGTRITPKGLGQVEEAEKLVKSLGFQQVRVRHHGDIARIEVEADELPRLVEPETRRLVAERFKQLGFLYVSVDIEGYRMGSMNAPLQAGSK